MEVPSFPRDSRSQVAGLAPLLGIGAAVSGKLTGTLTVQSEKVVRQFLWADGHATGALSNAKSELPGTFLSRAGKLDDGAYAAYLGEIRTPRANLWDLALQKAALSDADVMKLKAEYTLRLVQALVSAGPSLVTFQPSAFPGEPRYAEGLRLLMDAFADVPPPALTALFPDLVPQSSVFLVEAQEKALSPLPFMPEEKGLVTVVRNNAVLSEVFASSFLGTERITRLLAAFWLAGLIRLENSEVAARKAHEAKWTPEDRAFVEDVRSTLLNLERTTYYEWLCVPPAARPDEIRGAFESSVERLSAPKVPGLFHGEDAPLPEHLKLRLKEAADVLSNPAQRREYDADLASGKTGSFVARSVVGKELGFLAKAAQASVSGARDQAIRVLDEGLAALPDSPTLAAEYGRAVLAAGGGNSPLRDSALGRLKHALGRSPLNADLFETLGLWMEALSQPPKALEAFKRAVSLRPFSRPAQEGLLRLAPAEAAGLTVEAFAKNADRLNFYELLGLAPGAGVQQIHAAYRECTKRFHPDRFFNSADARVKESANDLYKKMVRAYTTLKNASRRAEYDEALRGPSSPAAGTPAGPSPAGETASGVPRSPQARRFYELALTALRQGKLDTAKLNLQLGLQVEPDNRLLQAKLREIAS